MRVKVPAMREVTVAVFAAVTVPRASSWIGSSPVVTLATPTVVGGRRPRGPPPPLDAIWLRP